MTFGQEGASVTIHGRSIDSLNKCEEYLIENGISAERILKVSGAAENSQIQQALIEETVNKFGRLDVLVSFV